MRRGQRQRFLSPNLPIRTSSSLPPCVVTTLSPPSSLARRLPMLGAPCVSLEPRVDPQRLEADGSTAADARVVQLATLAGRVDRVTADACILRPLGNGQPNLHRPSARAPHACGGGVVFWCAC